MYEILNTYPYKCTESTQPGDEYINSTQGRGTVWEAAENNTGTVATSLQLAFREQGFSMSLIIHHLTNSTLKGQTKIIC